MTVVTQSTDCEARYRELVEREAQGEVLTRTDLEDILWEMRLDRDGHDRIAATARTRFHAAARREETAARREELRELSAEQERVRTAVNEKLARLQADYEAAVRVAQKPLLDFEAEHGSRLELLRDAAFSRSAIEDLKRTADPKIDQEIARLEAELRTLRASDNHFGLLMREAQQAASKLPAIKLRLSAKGTPVGLDNNHHLIEAERSRIQYKIDEGKRAEAERAENLERQRELQSEIEALKQSKLDWQRYSVDPR